jgi:two-component system sensor histidine kinase UhpB
MVARRLRPGVLEDLGLRSAVAALANDFTTATRLPVDMAVDPGCPRSTRTPSRCSTASPRRA